jgi:hypothetical protein
MQILYGGQIKEENGGGVKGMKHFQCTLMCSCAAVHNVSEKLSRTEQSREGADAYLCPLQYVLQGDVG